MDNRALEVILATSSSTALAAPAVRKWLHRRQFFDHPNERSSHTVPTPRGGGLACAAGAAVGVATAVAVGRPPSSSWVGVSWVLGGVGRADDILGLSAIPRLGAQAVSGAFVGAKAGGLFGSIVGVLAVPAIVNAFNFMDGINGISGGTASAWGLCTATDSTQAGNIRTQGCLAVGMGLGFLPFNIPSASMFLGDVGSYFIGGGIAVSVVESMFKDGRFRPSTAARTVAPMIPYLTDTGSTILRRYLRGGSLTQAHREHTYQRLLQETGWDHWRVSLLVTATATTCGLLSRSRRGAIALVPIAGAYLAAPAVARASIGRSRDGAQNT